MARLKTIDSNENVIYDDKCQVGSVVVAGSVIHLCVMNKDGLIMAKVELCRHESMALVTGIALQATQLSEACEHQVASGSLH